MAFPSTFADLQTAVKIRARLDQTGLDNQKAKDWINRAYFRVVIDTESNVLVGDMAMTANAYSCTLPSAIARIKSMSLIPSGQTAEGYEQLPLQRTTLDDILTRRSEGALQSQSGQYARFYALTGYNGIEFWPTPAAADTLRVWYAGFPTALSADGDVPIIEEPYASDLLEYGALVYAGDLLGDPAMADWQQSFSQVMGEYMAHLEAKAGTIPTHGHQWGSLSDTEQLYAGGPRAW